MASPNNMTSSQRDFCDTAKRFAKDSSPKALREHIMRVCEEKDYDPVVASIDLRNDLLGRLNRRRKLRSDAGPMKIQQDQRYEVELLKLISGIDKDVARYVYPIVKAYDVQGSVESSLTVKLIQYSTGQELPAAKPVYDNSDVDLDMLEVMENKKLEAQSE